MENKISQEMTAFKFFKERKRMCKAHDACIECEAYEREKKICRVGNELSEYCANEEYEKLKEGIALVERWSREHPARTMTDVLFEAFPEAQKDDDGMPNLCPQYVIKGYSCPDFGTYGTSTCIRCREEFWSKEAPEK